MTALSRINSPTDLNRIDETLGNMTVGESDLLVNKKTLINKYTLVVYKKAFDAISRGRIVHIELYRKVISQKSKKTSILNSTEK